MNINSTPTMQNTHTGSTNNTASNNNGNYRPRLHYYRGCNCWVPAAASTGDLPSLSSPLLGNRMAASQERWTVDGTWPVLERWALLARTIRSHSLRLHYLHDHGVSRRPYYPVDTRDTETLTDRLVERGQWEVSQLLWRFGLAWILCIVSLRCYSSGGFKFPSTKSWELYELNLFKFLCDYLTTSLISTEDVILEPRTSPLGHCGADYHGHSIWLLKWKFEWLQVLLRAGGGPRK